RPALVVPEAAAAVAGAAAAPPSLPSPPAQPVSRAARTATRTRIERARRTGRDLLRERALEEPRGRGGASRLPTYRVKEHAAGRHDRRPARTRRGPDADLHPGRPRLPPPRGPPPARARRRRPGPPARRPDGQRPRRPATPPRRGDRGGPLPALPRRLRDGR